MNTQDEQTTTEPLDPVRELPSLTAEEVKAWDALWHSLFHDDHTPESVTRQVHAFLEVAKAPLQAQVGGLLTALNENSAEHHRSIQKLHERYGEALSEARGPLSWKRADEFPDQDLYRLTSMQGDSYIVPAYAILSDGPWLTFLRAEAGEFSDWPQTTRSAGWSGGPTSVPAEGSYECSEGPPLDMAKRDHCGQVWCEPCQCHMNPKPVEDADEE